MSTKNPFKSKVFIELSTLLNVLVRLFSLLFNSFGFMLKNSINLYSISKNINTEYDIQRKNTNFNYSVYQSNSKLYSTWLDNLFNKTRLNALSFSLLAGLLTYIFGFIISFFVGFSKNYILSIPIYQGAFGISIAIFVLIFGSSSMHKSFDSIRPCFMISDLQYKNFINLWFKRLSNKKATLLCCYGLSLIFIGFATLSFYGFNLLEQYQLTSLRPKLFVDQGWFNEQYKAIKFLLICFYAVCIAFPLATASRILVINFFFLLDLKHLPIIPISTLLRTRLRGITNLYMLITFFWFIGAILVYILFIGNMDFISSIVILFISILGLITFLCPQIIYHILLKRSEMTSTKWILTSFYEKLNTNLTEANDKKIISPFEAMQKINLVTLGDYISASVPSSRWIYNPMEVILFLISQLITFLISNQSLILK